ncbi:NmrA family protein [Streptomyces davaonensis JCM 4913]|uniref:NmrA family protein n=1 Tax=Streptomyces davaonensis (strain DSM 101723 / JCM 4913 / KCC S-0913 / 768) TaxID=1214101 RepID=K4R8K2_STRDJ|nr:NAD(P)H-binding protein [Streptomyces davaonensis]CCK29024.1 NmrA family protein [Streptomyces davaonensis JCM 4913]
MIVVTGATGNVGRPLVRALVEAGERVTAVSRRAPAAEEIPAGVRHHTADLADLPALKPALDGASALFLLTSGEFIGSGGDLGAVMEVAKAAGVGRVVLLSSQGVGTGHHPSALEDAVRESGVEWTILRPGGFHSNALQWAESVRTRREVAAPFGGVALPAIDPVDIAGAAAVTLRQAGHGGKTYDLTGPAPISPREQTMALQGALGEPVRFVELTRAEARAHMVGFMPEPVADATLDMLGSPPEVLQRVSPDAERLLGRRPYDFADWAARHAQWFK